MYLDFEDHHPETPRVERVISVREGILLSIIAHLLLVVLYFVLPRSFFAPASAETVPVKPDNQQITFVDMRPLVDKPAPPKRPAEASDMDRQSATRVKPPDATNPLPFSRGNTPERKEGAPAEPAPPVPTPTPPTPAPPQPEQSAEGLTPAAPTPPAPRPSSAANASRAFSNLGQYVQSENFENVHGGSTDQSADIQFDSMGVDFGPWLRRFKDQIERNWIVPEAAMSLKGHVVIQFTVLRNGTIIGMHVLQPSEIQAFTTSAGNALKLSNPTSQLPTEYPADHVVITVTFHYNEEDIR